MSWSQRFSQFSGRWSPFARSPLAENGPTKVSDADFSYITSEDLKNGDYDDKTDTNRDTDVLVLKNKRNTFQVHFPVHSIDRGELTVGHVREQAAKKLECDVKRTKLLYRGKALRDDIRACREEGIKEGVEVMCVVGEDLSMDGGSSSESDGGSDQVDSEAAKVDQPKRKRIRNRGKKKKGKKRAESVDSMGLVAPDSIPSRIPTPKPTVPTTPQEKLDMIYETLQSFTLQAEGFKMNPPSEPSKKEFEHKKLSEMILQQVLLKLDAVETDDVDARARRKGMVKQTQQLLVDLDTACK